MRFWNKAALLKPNISIFAQYIQVSCLEWDCVAKEGRFVILQDCKCLFSEQIRTKFATWERDFLWLI